MEGKFPLRAENVEWSKAGDGYSLIDGSGKNMRIDAVSFLVWIQCDGKTSVSEIVDVFSVGGNKDIIESAIDGVLEKLTTASLLKWV